MGFSPSCSPHGSSSKASALPAQANCGLSLPQLVAAKGRTQGMLLALGSLGGVRMQKRGPTQPLEDTV